MVAYLDSSAILDAVLEEGTALIDHLWTGGPVYASELLELECRRAIFREQMGHKLNDEELVNAFERLSRVLGQTNLVQLSPSIKKRAGEAFPIHVKTLDALHLATALAVKTEFGEAVVLFSRDQTMNRCARLLDLSAPWLA